MTRKSNRNIGKTYKSYLFWKADKTIIDVYLTYDQADKHSSWNNLPVLIASNLQKIPKISVGDKK